jgi:hypothetical protein
MPYIPFTDEQKVLANSVDLEQFLRMRGEKLERVGREHKLIYYDGSGRHDSITLRGSTWFDHKNQIGGGAIKFMQEFYDMDFLTAVQELLGQTITLLLEEDVDIRYIQRMLGHSSITTTQIYTHVTSAKQKEILKTKHPRNKLNID